MNLGYPGAVSEARFAGGRKPAEQLLGPDVRPGQQWRMAAG
jgi:hypothetical protein